MWVRLQVREGRNGVGVKRRKGPGKVGWGGFLDGRGGEEREVVRRLGREKRGCGASGDGFCINIFF